MMPSLDATSYRLSITTPNRWDDGNTPPIVKPARQIDSPVRTEAPKLTRSQNTAEDNRRSKSQRRQCPLSRRANINTNKNTSVSMRDKQC